MYIVVGTQSELHPPKMIGRDVNTEVNDVTNLQENDFYIHNIIFVLII